MRGHQGFRHRSSAEAAERSRRSTGNCRVVFGNLGGDDLASLIGIEEQASARYPFGFIASVRVATDKLSWMSAVSFASPIRCRHRVSESDQDSSRCWKNSSPQKNWK